MFNNGNQTINTIITSIHKWVLSTIALIIVGYVGVLGYVAVKTERDVVFWPPKIGPGPKTAAIKEIKDLKVQISTIMESLIVEQKTLNKRLSDARTSMATVAGGYASYSTSEWKENIRGYEKNIEEFDKKYIQEMKKLENEIKRIEKRLVDVNLVENKN